MRRLILLFVVILSAQSFSQWNSAAIKLGVFSPSAAESGFIVGYEGGKQIDQHLYLGWSVDWFNKNYVDKSLVNEYNQIPGIGGGEINELRAKTNLHDIPIMLTFTANFPVAPRTKVYGTLGLGAEVLLISYRNFQNPDESEFQGAFDFNWRLGVGGAYEIGATSDVFAELTFHSSAPSWEYTVDDPNSGFKRTFERKYDMSGIMGRIGVKFFF